MSNANAFSGLVNSVSNVKVKEAKEVNYSPELTASIVSDYKAGISVDLIAESAGKTVKSIVAKLARTIDPETGVSVYKKKEYVTKKGTVPIRKSAHAQAIGAILNLSESDVDSLEKATKTALETIFNALANSKPIDG